MFWYFSLFSQIPWFFKTNNRPFNNKTTQDFVDFWDLCGNFKAKTKIEDEGILKKKSFVWFLLLHITLIGCRDTPSFCYVKHPNVTSSFWTETLHVSSRIFIAKWFQLVESYIQTSDRLARTALKAI